MKLLISLIATCMLFASSGLQASQYSGEMLRGINAAYKGEGRGITAGDMKKLQGWGVNVIRLGIRTDSQSNAYGGFYKANGRDFNDAAFDNLDKVINAAARSGIYVIIATPGYPGSKDGSIWRDYRYWDKNVELWKYIAKRYAGNPHVIGYHPMDEPNLMKFEANGKAHRARMLDGTWSYPAAWKNTTKDYYALIERIGKAINSISPDKLVVISGFGLGAKPINFGWLKPVNVKNAVYSFNFYVPAKFANAGKQDNRTVAYNRARDLKQIKNALRPVIAFSKKYNAKVIVSGFGLTYRAEKNGAAQWMNDVIGIFESNRINWLYFSYTAKMRTPDLVNDGRSNKFVRSENTERLQALKRAWALNR